MRVIIITLFAAAVLTAPAFARGAQAPAPAQPAPAPPGAQPPVSDGLPTPPPNYTYEPAGRRDPFVSLINRGAETGAQSGRVRPEGIGGILVDEVVVRGIVQSRGGYVAMIGSPSGRTYSIKPGDRLMDGSVRTITPQAVILMQEVNDPLSLEKQREVRKFLRAEVK
jgi:type IV pilus assembly protein PilP